jgi:hypothetical protein
MLSELNLSSGSKLPSGVQMMTGISRSPERISALRSAVRVLIFAAAAFCSIIISAQPTHAGQASIAQQVAQAIAPGNSSAVSAAPITQYTLSPEKTRQAQALARTGRRLYFAEFFWSLLILWLSLRTGWAAKIRDWATRAASNTFVQAAIFCPLLVLTLDFTALPLHAWAHSVLIGYGLSVQGWSSWLLDLMKSEAIDIILATFAGWILFLLIRRSPRRWWIGAWVGAVLLIIVGVYVAPLVIEPLFYDFHPLSDSHPQLVRDVEQTIARAGISIPENRILEMVASQKLNERLCQRNRQRQARGFLGHVALAHKRTTSAFRFRSRTRPLRARARLERNNSQRNWIGLRASAARVAVQWYSSQMGKYLVRSPAAGLDGPRRAATSHFNFAIRSHAHQQRRQPLHRTSSRRLRTGSNSRSRPEFSAGRRANRANPRRNKS